MFISVSVTIGQVVKSRNRSLSSPISCLLIMANNLCIGRIWKTGQEKSDTSFGKPSQLLVLSGLETFLSWRLKLYHCFLYSLMDFFPQNCLIVFLKSTCVLGWRDIPWQCPKMCSGLKRGVYYGYVENNDISCFVLILLKIANGIVFFIPSDSILMFSENYPLLQDFFEE